MVPTVLCVSHFIVCIASYDLIHDKVYSVTSIIVIPVSLFNVIAVAMLFNTKCCSGRFSSYWRKENYDKFNELLPSEQKSQSAIVLHILNIIALLFVFSINIVNMNIALNYKSDGSENPRTGVVFTIYTLSVILYAFIIIAHFILTVRYAAPWNTLR